MWRAIAAVTVTAVLAGGAAAAWLGTAEYAPLPALDAVANRDRLPVPSDPLVTGDPAELQDIGRQAFYRETFGNEYFLSDVIGLLDGGLRPWEIARAVILLGGQGTANLRVRAAEPVTLGGHSYDKGAEIDTGLDVPRGGWAPLGIKLFWDRGRLRAGITCALCHVTVDRDSGQVIEGAPNADLNVGLMLALAPNSAAYFPHVTMPTVAPYLTDPARTVPTSSGDTRLLPDPSAFERDVDAMLAAWPRGNFDSTLDLVSNPTQIPDNFTARAHPYGWSGFAAIGPYHGLSALANNVHGLNADGTLVAASAPALFGLDPEVYLGILLQNAARRELRYVAGSDRKPSHLLAEHDPTPDAPGLSHAVLLPSHPAADLLTTDGVMISLPGAPVWYHINAISVFQNSLQPPAQPPEPAPAELVRRGREVFEQAGCPSCHSGPALTNHAVIPVTELNAHWSRAQARAAALRSLAEPAIYPPETPVPLPPDVVAVSLDLSSSLREKVERAWALDGRLGGYKVKGLIGLAWTAPYLHDGSVADLTGLFDSEERGRTITTLRASAASRASHVTGFGHEFYVEDGARRDALIAYLRAQTRLTEDHGPSLAGSGEAP